jgi:hypothetical protein
LGCDFGKRNLLHAIAMSDYDTDILEWSEHQAGLLRRAAAGERVNDLDWPNIIEEIESVGRNEIRAVEGHLVQALLHDLKAGAWPLAREVAHWRAEARGQRADAAAAYSPSMRQRIDLAQVYRRALQRLPDEMDGQKPLPVLGQCPLTLDQILSGETLWASGHGVEPNQEG